MGLARPFPRCQAPTVLGLGHAQRVAGVDQAPRPRLPDSSLASSDRISPNMLVVTMTSNRSGARTRQRGGGVDNHFVQRHIGIVASDPAHLAQEQPIGQFHDIGLVNGGDFLPAPARQFEASRPRDAGKPSR